MFRFVFSYIFLLIVCHTYITDFTAELGIAILNRIAPLKLNVEINFEALSTISANDIKFQSANVRYFLR